MRVNVKLLKGNNIITVKESSDNFIPPSLTEPVNAALEWINTSQEKQYEVTGLVDENQALNSPIGTAYELGLVLCDGEICKCERVKIQRTDDKFSISLSERAPDNIPALLDPPAGLRTNWLDEQLQKYEFLLLLFYRGRW